ncbi:MAG TPA: saccharopine dehydrogenase C-terminal domain-containing protein [Atopostipes sp.]|nr:saccharopine dehydrogenase C-terminal domain-containing protein [Atopostipes sp.]
MKFLLLGGAGTMAKYVLEKVLSDGAFEEVIVADYNGEAAEKVVAANIDSGTQLRAVQADVHDKKQLIELMNEVDVVGNCTGPYYLLLEPVMDAFFESNCKKYVDLCDDIEAIENVQTEENIQKAKELDKTIIIGLGGSPGVIPVEIMYGSSLMDDVEDVQLSMLLDELEEGGTAVWDHMFENFAGEVATYENGEVKVVDGLSDVIEYSFPEQVFGDVGTVKLYDLGHPEVFTLPQALPNIQNIKIKCAYYPPASMDFIVGLERVGLLNADEVEVDGQKIAPRNILLEKMKDTVMNPEFEGGFVKEVRDPKDYGTGTVIDVYGTKDGNKVHFQSAFQTDMGTVTGYPMAVGAKMLTEGKLTETGIMIPENAIPEAERKDFVDEVYQSIEDAGHPCEKVASVTYGL